MMNTRVQTQTKSNSTPMRSFAPMQSGLLQRKCACGGSPGVDGECAECRRKRFLGERLQAKLRINHPGDRYEQEADRVAEQVMRMSEVGLQRQVENEGEKILRTKPVIQHGVTGGEDGSEAPPVVHEVLCSPGQPIDPATRAFMESRFGHDFSQVRVHTDTKAAESAQAINAQAYTVGSDVVFGAGQYTPATTVGQRLLTHELTHVVQQKKTTKRNLLQRRRMSPEELEALERFRGELETLRCVMRPFTIVLNEEMRIQQRAEVTKTIRQAIEPLAHKAGRQLKLERGSIAPKHGDLELNFVASGMPAKKFKPCAGYILGNEGGGEIYVDAHVAIQVCAGAGEQGVQESQLATAFEPGEPEFGRFLGVTAVHELGHLMAQLAHTSDPNNFMNTKDPPHEHRTREGMRRHWAGQKTFSSGQTSQLVQAIRTCRFTGGMRVTS